MDLSTGRSVLVCEARELLGSMEGALADIQRFGLDKERINTVFRAAHTIKGSSGLFGLVLVERFTQRLEDVLDRVRGGTVAPTDELLALSLDCCDYIGQLVDAIEAESEAEDPDPRTRARLLDALAEFAAPVHARAETKPHLHHVSLRFEPDFFEGGVCPTEYIKHLSSIGELAYVTTTTDALPAAEAFDPERVYLGFELGVCAESEDAIRAAVSLAGEGVTLRIQPPGTPWRAFDDLLGTLGPARERVRQALVEAGWMATTREARRSESVALVSLRPTSRADEAPSPEAGAQLSLDVAKSALSPIAPDGSAPRALAKASAPRMVKVDAERLDQLIDLVGELVIASEGVRSASAAERGAIGDAVARVSQLVEQVRDQALTMRMTPVGEVFNRFPRIVREVSRELGKQIDLEITGADAELDKSMVDRLADPLLHIVRNAIDHGIEPVAERRTRGKPDVGRLALHAHHESGCIVVEVRDDGRGLDPEQLRKKAIERGLIGADETLTQQECYRLIFAPGFSTAATVTSLSGRGVGMDVVKRGIEQLRGEIEIESSRGGGSTFRLRLPLTLAIIDGFHVEVEDTSFVIPLDAVVECVDLRQSEGLQRIYNLRGEPLPYVRLRDVFRLGGRGVRESLVVVNAGAHRVGLVVDRLLGNSQAVIKPLGELFRGVPGVSASTIKGDGGVALILDVAALAAGANRSIERERRLEGAA